MPTMIHQFKFNPELKKKLYTALNEHAVQTTGIIDGWDDDQVAFEARGDNDEFQGAVVVQRVFGQMHFKYLFVEEKFRDQGIGKQLMQKGIEYAREKGCSFAYLETCSYQAPEFYAHLGFNLEYKMEGFQNGISLMYFKMKL
jgi:GNAT superfamily N-acetyltransferase